MVEAGEAPTMGDFGESAECLEPWSKKIQTTSPGRDPGADQVQLVGRITTVDELHCEIFAESIERHCLLHLSICKQEERPTSLNFAKSDAIDDIEKLSLGENKLCDMGWKEDRRR